MANPKTVTPFPQFLLFLLIFTFPAFCAATDTIAVASPIKDPDSIVSGGRVFKLGFFSPAGAAARYLAVFYVVSEDTPIWIANRENPLPDASGSASISDSGNLILVNGRNQTIWTTNISSSPMTTAARILDSGNLVLTEVSTERIVWDSFSHPSNVFVPTMQLTDNVITGDKTLLSSWRNESWPETGAFTTGMQARPVPQIFIWRNGSPWWRSGPWNGQILMGIEEMYKPSLYFSLEEYSNGTFQFSLSKVKLLLKFVLNSSGTFEEKFWNDKSRHWDVVWAAPKSDCELYGTCGPFGVCNAKSSPICSCMTGFQPRDRKEWEKGIWTGGCERRKALECNKTGQGFLKMEFMKVPDFPERYVSGNEDECSIRCLRNCSCIAYTHHVGLGCLVWRDSLVDLQRFSSVGSDLYVRLARSELDHVSSKKMFVIVVPIALALVFMFVCIFIGLRWTAKKRGQESNDRRFLPDRYTLDSIDVVFKEDMEKVTIDEFPFFTYETMLNSTNQFHNGNMVGKGGFGLVYKGRLDNGKEIAVKRLSAASGQGTEEFMNEVVLISKLQHWNLVRLLGCCVENEEKMLVYEYMPNKSLDLCLFDPGHQCHKILVWKKRLNIMEGIGRGLLYLHRESRLKVIHRDLKSSNVLLDEDLNPKISDFGMARIFGGNEDQDNTTRVVGTYGYMAPEYAMEGKFSEKTDVYSFGVLMLEIVSGKKNTNYYNHEWSLSLIGCAWKMWSEGHGKDFVDETMSECLNFLDEILRCIHIALFCVQEYPKDRPSIQKVLSMLTYEITKLPLPEKPVFAEKWSRFQVGSTQSMNQSESTVLEGR